EVSGKRYWRIEFFNDDPRTTHADVLEVLQRARENIIAGMIGENSARPWHQRWLEKLRALSPGSDTCPAFGGSDDAPQALPRESAAFGCGTRASLRPDAIRETRPELVDA